MRSRSEDRAGRAAELSGAGFRMHEEGPGAPGLVLVVRGEVDMATGLQLRARLERAVTAGVRTLVVDLSGVSFIDSVSLAAVVATRHKLGDSGRLAVVANTPYVLLILEATALDGVLDVFADREAAKAFAFG